MLLWSWGSDRGRVGPGWTSQKNSRARHRKTPTVMDKKSNDGWVGGSGEWDWREREEGLVNLPPIHRRD